MHSSSLDSRFTSHSENITRLDLRTGTYSTLCYVPGYCLNACAVSPADYQIYCQTRSQPPMFVRVNCATDTLVTLISDLEELKKGQLELVELLLLL